MEVPIEVRAELGRTPPTNLEMSMLFWASYIQAAGETLLEYAFQGDNDKGRDKAAKIAAASIRLVEYLNQDWP